MKSGGLFLGIFLILIIIFLLFQNYNTTSQDSNTIFPEIFESNTTTQYPAIQHYHGGHVTPKIISKDVDDWIPNIRIRLNE